MSGCIYSVQRVINAYESGLSDLDVQAIVKDPLDTVDKQAIMGRELGRNLYGPNTTDAFAAIPRHWILEAIANSLSWHQENELNSVNSVLNACRGWRFIVTSEFSSKLDGAKWALQQQGCPDIVSRAIAARKTGDELPAAQVMTLYDTVMMTNRAELATDTK